MAHGAHQKLNLLFTAVSRFNKRQQ